MNKNNETYHPPRWAERFFEFYCDPEISEELQGDLLDRFYANIKKSGYKKARRNYILNVLRFLSFHTLKRRNKSNRAGIFFLIPNYFKTGFRSLLRQGSISALNLFGLTLGLICFMLLFAFVRHELSFEDFHLNKSRIARINMTWIFGDTSTPTSKATSIVSVILSEEIPEVDNVVRFNNQGGHILRHADKVFKEENLIYADSTLFDIFSFKLLQGNPDKCLVEPNSLLLSQSMAAKYFGTDVSNEVALGRTFMVNNSQEFIVTGIFEDLPNNSHLQFDFLASMSTLPQSKNANWDNSEFATYFQIYPGSSFEEIQEKIDDLLVKSEVKEFAQFDIEPITKIYLHSELLNDFGPQSDFRNVILFGSIGVLILLIACINYLNLVTAKSTERAKEVGLRKVLGAFRNQLFFQFMSESILICFGSLLLAYGLSLVLLDGFNILSGQRIPIEIFADNSFILTMCGVTLLVSFLAGSYPSFILSNYRPVSVLKGKIKATATGFVTRKILIVVQFATSIFLIIGTMVVYEQLSYIQNKKLGFDKDHVLILPVDDEMKKNLNTIKNELTNVPGIISASYVSHTPGNISFMTTFQNLQEDNPRQLMNAAKVDHDFLETSGVELVYGNNFNERSNYEERYGFLLNESAMEFFGWSLEDAVGKKVGIWGGDTGVVVGVIKDFHNRSLHTEIDKMILFNESSDFFYSSLLVKVSGQNLSSTINSIGDFWREMIPHRPFEYSFLEDRFMKSYNSETRLSKLFTLFAGLAILIACLGLLGLSTYSALQKAKEMSIRKVHGASPLQILGRFSWEFALLIIVAFIIAAPLSFLASEKWLQGFAYKTELYWGLFIFSGIFSLAITMITISLQSVKLAMINPAVILKNNE